MLQYRCLAIASLIITASFAARAAQAETKDPRPTLPDISLPAPTLPPVALAAENAPGTPFGETHPPGILHPEILPDDPDATQQQGAAQQSAQPQSGPQQPQGPISAEEQLKIQEKQRVLAVMATFNTTRNHDALPLSPGQKFRLFFKSQTDPWPFTLSAVIAGINQGADAFPAYGQGVQGYAKYYGAAYGDSFIGNFFGNAVLTSLWHEDPRFFQKGTGSYTSRALWAATASIWCKRDNGTWGPNYANVAGNLIGAAIANVYYPASERTAWDTVSRGLTVTAQGAIGAEIIEFWPDMVRRYQRNHAAKLARQAAQQDAQAAQAAQNSTAQPSTAPAGDPKP